MGVSGRHTPAASPPQKRPWVGPTTGFDGYGNSCRNRGYIPNLPAYSGRCPGTGVYRKVSNITSAITDEERRPGTPGRRSDEFGKGMWVCEYGWLRIVSGGRRHCVVAAMNLPVLQHTRITTNPVSSNPQNNHQNNFTVWDTSGGSRADYDTQTDCFVSALNET